MESSTTKRKPFKRVNNTTLAYIAGIIDGEGYFCGVMSGKYGSIRIGVVNCRKDLLKWLQSFFGGQIYCKSKYPGLSKLECWDWHVGEKKRFLKLMKPYIKLKRAQLEVALAFFSLPHAPEKKRRLALKIQELNKQQYSLRDDIV
jgi:hypothetical protein